MNVLKRAPKILQALVCINMNEAAGVTKILQRGYSKALGRTPGPGTEGAPCIKGSGRDPAGRGALREDHYFYDKQKEQLQDLKNKLNKKMSNETQKKGN